MIVGIGVVEGSYDIEYDMLNDSNADLGAIFEEG